MDENWVLTRNGRKAYLFPTYPIALNSISMSYTSIELADTYVPDQHYVFLCDDEIVELTKVPRETVARAITENPPDL